MTRSIPALLAVAAFGLLAAACAPAPTTEQSAADPVATALDRMDAGALEAHVRFLADDLLGGRMTGTPGYEISARYVEAQFRAIGLLPGNGDSYFQQVPYVSAQLDVETATFVLDGPDGRKQLQFRDDFVTGADKVRETVAVTAPVIFAGYGVHAPDLDYDDFAGIDVSGKIVAIFSGAPRHFGANERAYHSSSRVKAEDLVARGAVGVIGLRKRSSIEKYQWADSVRNAGTLPTMGWLSDTGEASNYHPELRTWVGLSEAAAIDLFTGSPHSYAELLELEASDQPLPRFATEVTASASRDSALSRTDSPNVLAMLPGSDPALADQVVVFMGHLDHIGTGAPVDGDAIYNGAYDNAMGISLLIEAARALAGIKPKRSILFAAVGGEERGLLGSDYLANYPPVPAQQLVAAVNLDMPLFLYPVADVVAFGGEHSTLADAVRRAAEAEGMVLTPDPMPEEVLFLRSDHYSLVRKGVPSIYLVPGFSSKDAGIDGEAALQEFLTTHYHKPSDDLDRPVDWASALRFARANVRIGVHAANDPVAAQWHAGNFFGRTFAPERTPEG